MSSAVRRAGRGAALRLGAWAAWLAILLPAPARPQAAAAATPPTALPPPGWVQQARPDSVTRPVPPQQAVTARRSHEQMRLTRGVYLGGTLALATGAVAWWSQDRADRAYDRYMHSAGVARQRRYLARATDYDRVAGWAFLGMESGLALAAYHLFF